MSRQIPTMKDDIVVDSSPLIQQYLPPKPSSLSSHQNSHISGSHHEGSSSGVGGSSSGIHNLAPGARVGGGGIEKLNRKQILLQHNIELRKKFESMVLEWQEILCDTVTEDVLGEAANRIKQSHYQEIIEERNIGKLCGYPLCSKPPRDIKGKFRISLQERKVFDISILKQYCSSTCLSASRWLESQMTEEPIYLLNNDPAYLRTTRVSIVPLGMELEAFQVQRALDQSAMEATVTPSFKLPSHGLEKTVSHKAPSTSSTSSSFATAPSSSTTSFTSPPPPTLFSFTSAKASAPVGGSAYVRSILASVPATPSFIKIVEHDPSTVQPREPLDMTNMDQEMREVFGDDDDDEKAHGSNSQQQQQQYDIVEGFRVPVTASRRREEDPQGIERRMAQVSLSDGAPTAPLVDSQGAADDGMGGVRMQRSGSSMSMDTL